MPVDNNDDDLFDDDDGFLDEATLNALDEVDAKIQAERLKRQQCDSSQDAVPPPAKRPRLDYQQSVSARLEAIDNFPEIVVSGNGRYGIPKGEIVLSFSQASSQSPSQPEQQQQQPPEPPKRTTPPEPPKHSYKPPSKPSPAPQQTRRPAPPLKSTRPPVTVVQTTRQRTPTPPPAPPKVSPQEQEVSLSLRIPLITLTSSSSSRTGSQSSKTPSKPPKMKALQRRGKSPSFVRTWKRCSSPPSGHRKR